MFSLLVEAMINKLLFLGKELVIITIIVIGAVVVAVEEMVEVEDVVVDQYSDILY